MRLIFSVLALIVTICHDTAGQNRDKNYSFNIGVNLSSPKFIFLNQESFKKTIPNFQFAFNRDFFGNSPFAGSLSLGLNINSFNAGRQVGSAYSIKQINLSYLSLEAGPNYKVKVKNIGLRGGMNLRVSSLIKENYSSYYSLPSLSSSDLGLNGLFVVKLLSRPMRPYLQFNYYYGLNKIAKNEVMTSTGQSVNDYIRNRAIGLQIGFYFK